METAVARRILLVEDEEALAKLLCRKLSREPSMHLEVDHVKSGLEALDSIRDAPAFDLIVSDVNMPGLDGLELHARLRDLGHATPFIFMTGRMLDPRLPSDVPVLVKPFPLGDLVEAIRQVLGR